MQARRGEGGGGLGGELAAIINWSHIFDALFPGRRLVHCLNTGAIQFRKFSA